MTIRKIQLGGGGGTFDGTMDDIPNGTIYVKTENNLTDAEKTILSNTSGTNSGDETTASIQTKRPLKTIKGQSLEGAGNIDLTKSDVGLSNVDNTSDVNKPISTATQTALDGKQATLVSATNIKTINGTTLLGSGDLVVGGASPTILTLAGNQSTAANTTPITLTDMSFSYAANSVYTIDLYAFVQSAAATTGMGFQIDVSTAVTKIGLSFFHQLATTGTITGGSSVADDTSLGVSSGLPNTTENFVQGKGILITGANTGTAQFRFRSETTAVTTINANSKFIITKIS